MVAIAEYQNGIYEIIADLAIIAMLCIDGKWYYDYESYELGISTFPPLQSETVIFKGDLKNGN